MLYFVCILVMILGGLIAYKSGEDENFLAFLPSAAMSVIASIVVIVMTISMAVDYPAAEANHKRILAQREGIIHQMLNPQAKDELFLQNKAIFDEAKHFNEDLAYNKSIQRNFWLGILYPNIYDDIDYINYEDFYEVDINLFNTEQEILY